jgi:hypothetical protein
MNENRFSLISSILLTALIIWVGSKKPSFLKTKKKYAIQNYLNKYKLIISPTILMTILYITYSKFDQVNSWNIPATVAIMMTTHQILFTDD